MRLLELVSVALRLAAGGWLLARLDRPSGAVRDRAPVAVVIPARDEEATLPHLLASLAGQLGPTDELVVVDDGSTDGTAAAVAGEPSAVLVAAPPLAPGANGKAAACATGAAATANPTLVFLDADVTLEAGGLDRLLATHERTGGLLSVQPYHRVKRPYERLSAFFNVVTMMGTGAFTPLGPARGRGAFGPVLVTSRGDYDRVGGHAAIGADILDDVALAQRYVDSGRAVTCLAGRGTASFRMYPAGLHQLVEGWTKNLASGAGAASGASPVAVLLAAAWVSLCIQAAWWLGRAVIGGDVVGAAAYVAVAAQLVWLLRRIGSFGPVTAALYPVPLACFLVVFVRSAAITVVRGRVRWRGRDVSTRA